MTSMNNSTGIFRNSALGVYLVFKLFQIIINGIFFLINANGGIDRGGSDR